MAYSMTIEDLCCDLAKLRQEDADDDLIARLCLLTLCMGFADEERHEREPCSQGGRRYSHLYQRV